MEDHCGVVLQAREKGNHVANLILNYDVCVLKLFGMNSDPNLASLLVSANLYTR